MRFALTLCVVMCWGVTASAEIKLLDLDGDTSRQIVVDRDGEQYLGHPTTVLLEDGRTILAVFPKGHGRGAIVYKRSADGGLTWSDRLATPANWEKSKETPTIHRVVDATGKKRLILFSSHYPMRMSVSEDDGGTWSELAPVGKFGGTVGMASVLSLTTGAGHYMALFHDHGKYLDREGTTAGQGYRVFKSMSSNGGLTWSMPELVTRHADAMLCEPGAVRSPDGKQIAVMLREQSRKYNAFVIFSDDEGATWTTPREVPNSLTGDRHTCKYTPDGRLFISMRDMAPESPTKGDWIAWVGTYADIVNSRDGQYRVRLKDNHSGHDCGYAGVEVLPDGTIVTTSYGHWTHREPPYILSVRLKLAELDAMK
jgi:hypothetical protein